MSHGNSRRPLVRVVQLLVLRDQLGEWHVEAAFEFEQDAEGGIDFAAFDGPTEWHLLEVLVRNEGKLVPHRQLLQEVWGPRYETETNYLRVYLARLRRKLEREPARPRHLLTEPGVGDSRTAYQDGRSRTSTKR
jgi:hypothetical protein